MGRYLVPPPEETAWHIDAGDFVRRLLQRWPDAEVRTVEDPQRPYAVDFVIHDVAGERVDGSLDRAGQTSAWTPARELRPRSLRGSGHSSHRRSHWSSMTRA